MSSDSLIELQKDHNTILDVIDELASKIDDLRTTEESNSQKLDSILEAINTAESEQRRSLFRR